MSLPYKAALFLIVILANPSQCRENWDMKYIVERGGLVYAPNSDKPYTGNVHKNDQNGDPLVTGVYKTGRKHGDWTISSSDNSGVITEETFDLGRLIRRASYIFDSSGQPTLNGEFNEWYLNGNKQQETIFLLGDKHGKEKLYYESGGIKSQGEYRGNEKHGYWTNYLEDGTKDNSGPFQHNERSGKWVWFYPNGKVQGEYMYANGKANGLSKAWSETGQLLFESEWVNGHEHGKYMQWHSSGSKHVVGEMSYSPTFGKSFKTGQWTVWWNNGIIEETGAYSIGQDEFNEYVSIKTGRWQYYEPLTRKIMIVEEYDSLGQPHGQWKHFIEGRLFRSDIFSEGECKEIRGFDSTGALTYKSEAIYSVALTGNFEGSTPQYQQTGACTSFTSEGSIDAYGLLDGNGFRIGIWTNPNAMTPLEQRKYYISPWSTQGDFSREDSIYTELLPDGRIKMQGAYTTTNDRNWHPVQQLNYVRHGKWVIWSEKQERIIRPKYDNGYSIIDF